MRVASSAYMTELLESRFPIMSVPAQKTCAS